MAAFQIEQNTCTGRGFASADANGYLAKFYTWVTKTPASGGPGWTIIDDQSTAGTDPYIVISDVASPTVNEYNTGGSGGAPKFIKVGLSTTEAGYIRIQCYLWWDSTSHTGYGLWSGVKLQTLDDAVFTYDFRGGDEQMILQTRIGTDWDYFILDDWVGDTNLVEASTVIGTLQSGITSGDSVTLQLDTGEASLFSVDSWYYMTDLDDHTYIDYVKCTAVDTGTDQITIDNAKHNFTAGTIIGAYMHRYYTLSNWNIATTEFNRGYINIPYMSRSDEPSWDDGDIEGSCGFSYASDIISLSDPDDDGNYAVQRPLLYEDRNFDYDTDYMNRAYGVTKNLYITSNSGLSIMQDGRTIGSTNYISIYRGSTEDYLILDTESTS